MLTKSLIVLGISIVLLMISIIGYCNTVCFSPWEAFWEAVRNIMVLTTGILVLLTLIAFIFD